MKIEKINIDLITPYGNNAKIHTREQIEQIKKSIEMFGNNDPIAVDENDIIIEGHGRLYALQELGYKEVEIIRLSHLTDEQKRAYMLVHNKLTMNTGFDIDLLETELKSIEQIDMGQFEFECDFENITGLEFDDFTEDELQPPPEPKTRKGDVYRLGSHRLMCGDSTDGVDVDKLMGGEIADLCLTDPPYNVNYHGDADGEMTIENDNMGDSEFYDFLYKFYIQMFRCLKPGGAYYIFHADTEGLNFRAALIAAGGTLRETLVWVKNALVLGRQDYQWKHEPCLYGWKDGATHYFINDRCQTTVFDEKPDFDEMSRDQLQEAAEKLYNEVYTTVIYHDKPTKNDLHPTMKPVLLCTKLIRNSSKKDELVVDFFGGSGSTMIACEQTGRKCYAMELDPGYCDVIVGRWEKTTGKTAELIGGEG